MAYNQSPNYYPNYSDGQPGYPQQAYPPPPGPPSGYGGPPPPIPTHSYPGGPPPIPMNYPNQYAPPLPPPNTNYNPSYIPPQQYQPPPGPPPGQYHGAPYQRPSSPYPPPIQSYAPSGQEARYLGVSVLAPHVHPSTAMAPGYNPSGDVEAIRTATKKMGTDENLVISTLAPRTSMEMIALSNAFLAKTGKTMEDTLDGETSYNFKTALHGLALGPLGCDVWLAHLAIDGAGTNEILLTELLLGRSNEELQLLIGAYQQTYRRSLVDSVRDDLSGKTKRLFTMALAASRPPDHFPVNPQQVESDVQALYKAGTGKIGTDEIAFFDILVNRSTPHLTALCNAYKIKYKKTLSRVIKSEFSGHSRDALLYIVKGVKDKRLGEGPGIWRDVQLLEASMKGFGTKDEQLIWRVLRAHWDRPRMERLKAVYQKRYRKSLRDRISGETSGSYKKLMLALVS
ncbi:Annexin [Armillaria solidipes]|uniref:Annexin n=1 Tax=Armillaria solidipes TaxID=1076256 RepID=A0A2H3BLJ5_9AGAR|nr:Annexin [Armillaria solidipes]